MIKFFLLISGLLMTGALSTIQASSESVVGGPRGNYPYLFKGTSEKNLVKTARDHQWSLNFPMQGNDTLLVIALRVEFKRDTSDLNTGNGLFGMRGGGDSKEQKYINKDTVYRYDKLPHDSLYFAQQLDAVSQYYNKVSRGRLTLEHRIYPSGSGETGYQVDSTMIHYSPGYKRSAESWDEYYERKTFGLVEFIRDAIEVADRDQSTSPFRNLYRDSNGILREVGTNKKAVILIFHAGSSYLTDGGMDGAAYADSPSDMIDAFINPDFFSYYQDTLELDQEGVTVTGSSGSILIDEVMMCSETSNQDGLNWGIQGILVNQIARQLGIPDLFSTSSGVTAIGAFCIMDFAGYSAGRGFIPPYPSAWVRAFMGWDRAHTVQIGENYTNRVKALSMVLDKPPEELWNDTTILLIPINDHEYYLVENRQRNLSGNRDKFLYDTLRNREYIRSYPFNFDLDENIDSVTGRSNVIQSAINNDISLPASGVLVWHVDERIIRKRMRYNQVNADSSYRGVRLVEADGINDLGVTFTNMFYQAAYDYGGAEDVFPHTRDSSGAISRVNSFGPYTSPSTRSNDGGHSFLEITIDHSSDSPRRERMIRSGGGDYFSYNYVDSIFNVTVRRDHSHPSWPRKAIPDFFYDPLLANLDSQSEDRELILTGASGRMYVFSLDSLTPQSFGERSEYHKQVNFLGDTLTDSSTSVTYLDSIPGLFTFSTLVNDHVYTPSKDGFIHVLRAVNSSQSEIEHITLPHPPSSYISSIGDSTWAVGLEGGYVVFGSGANTTQMVKLSSDSSVNAIAALRDAPEKIVSVQSNGKLSICNLYSESPERSTKISHGIPPFSLVTGDLNRNENSEIIVTDSRQGIWVYTSELELAYGWSEEPNDWPNAYHYESIDENRDRNKYHYNVSAPVFADIDRNGYLDIVVGGTNGVYALNYKGVLLSDWPAYLDNRYWYQRGSITSSPIILTNENSEPHILFSSPTGENSTYTFTKIESADRERGVVSFYRTDGVLDSIWDLSSSEVDTILTLNDSIIAPYVLPGGFIDALNSSANRPLSSSLPGSGPLPQSPWPITTGSPVTTSPLVARTDHRAQPDLFAVSSGGSVYRWRLPQKIMPDSLFWPQTGYDAARSFAYLGSLTDIIEVQTEPIEFFSYPNPTQGSREAVFKYQFSDEAQNVRLDIFSVTGFEMDSFRDISGSYPGWNEFAVPLRHYGPGVYRCRLEATINGRRHVKYWKMAVTK
ncbi:hypothetical protein QA601_03115 [Chitinispirillales bacterium ANBcel5]|uniref:hypothetical protein n=1 Tax=Cellulosispirillum alkaliphilum TaxID=3039283 RepID=UPI002A54D789|nr:hypothetical protein [Chitinispirillales bacterium ANBcel5]